MVLYNNNMTVKVISLNNVEEGKAEHALIHLCDGQHYSWIVAVMFWFSEKENKCLWGQGHYFEKEEDARRYYKSQI